MTVVPEETKDFTESFTIDFGNFKQFSAILSIKWANTLISIEIKSMSAKKVQNEFIKMQKALVRYMNQGHKLGVTTNQEAMIKQWNLALIDNTNKSKKI